MTSIIQWIVSLLLILSQFHQHQLQPSPVKPEVAQLTQTQQTKQVQYPKAGQPIAVYHGVATWFGGDWEYQQLYYKGQARDVPPNYLLLPQSWVGYGNYAAMPSDWGYHGRTVVVTWHGMSRRVQLLDVVRHGKDSRGFLSQGKIIDLGKEVFRQFAPLSEGRLEGVEVEVY